MDRKRSESGQYVEEVTLDGVIAVFEDTDLPVLTASEVAEELDCARPTAYNKLEKLAEQTELQKKKVGARAVVYIYLESS